MQTIHDLSRRWMAHAIKSRSSLVFQRCYMSSISVSRLHNKNGESGVVQMNLDKPVMGMEFWDEFHNVASALARDPAARCIVLSGTSKAFSFGLDVKDAKQVELLTSKDIDPARKADTLRRFLLKLQSTFSLLESTPPVIACVHSFCIGGAVDLICAADIRYCTKDTSFSIKEVDVGLAPDLGTLQRIERLVGSSSLVRELAFTGRQFGATEALQCGFVSRVFETKDEMMAAALEIASIIASKSPVAVNGIKQNLNFARGRPVETSLEYQAMWSAAALQSVDAEAGLRVAANPKGAGKLHFKDLTKY